MINNYFDDNHYNNIILEMLSCANYGYSFYQLYYPVFTEKKNSFIDIKILILN